MKVIKYMLYTKVNYTTNENSQFEDTFYVVKMPWSEANEEIAKKEAYNGEYTIEEIEDTGIIL